MNVAKRPVVVAFGDEILLGTGCVVGVRGVAAKRCVQDADVEDARLCGGIADGEVLECLPVREAAAVDRNVKVREAMGLRFLGRERMDALQCGRALVMTEAAS